MEPLVTVLSPVLQKQYSQIIKNIPLEELNSPYRIINADDIVKAHILLCDYFSEISEDPFFYGVKDMNLLLSAVARQDKLFFGQHKWEMPIEQASSLFFGLVKNHAFHDGNKRTALITLLLYLYKINKFPNVNQKELEKLALRVADNKLSEYPYFAEFKKKEDPEIRTIAKFLKSRTRNIDKNYYPLTYQEFNQKLKHYDCYLEEAGKGWINVFKLEKKFLTGKKPQKKLQIGFPGWKRQVYSKAVKEVLKKCELTATHGIDSQTFFKGSEPLYKIIEDYEPTLQRLRYK